MKSLKNTALILSLGFLFNCTGYVPPAQQFPSSNYPPNPYQNPYSPNAPPRLDADYNRRIANDRDRDETLSRANRRRGGDTCEDKDDDHECKELCREMYRRQDDREECEELTVNNINRIIEVSDVLRNPSSNSLGRMDLEDFDLYLNVSIAGFDRLISDYSRGDANEILVWLTESESATEVFMDEDDDFETFEELLELVDNFDSDEVEKPFTEEIDRRTLFEHAMYSGNELAVEWFLDYIFGTDPACNTIASEECFTVICKIGEGFEDEDNREDLLSFSEFEDFLEDDILGNDINSGNWEPTAQRSGAAKYTDAEQIEDIQDGDWVTALCGGLI